MDNNDNHSLIPDLPTRKVTTKDKIDRITCNLGLAQKFEKSLQKYAAENNRQTNEERQQALLMQYYSRLASFGLVPPSQNSIAAYAECILLTNNVGCCFVKKNVVYVFPIENPFIYSEVQLKFVYQEFIKNNSGKTFGCMLFIRVPPSEEEFLSIFFCHLKALSQKKGHLKYQAFPCHSFHVKLIRSKACKHVKECYNKYSNERIFAQSSSVIESEQNAKNRNIALAQIFDVSCSDLSLLEAENLPVYTEINTKPTPKSGRNVALWNDKEATPQTGYENLIGILFGLTNGHYDLLVEFFKVLGKIYLGNDFWAEFKDTKTPYPLLTIIKSKNVAFLEKFLKTIFDWKFIKVINAFKYPSDSLRCIYTEYSIEQLENRKGTGFFFKSLCEGKLVNISKQPEKPSKFILNDPGKKLASGERYTEIKKDTLFGDVSLSNTMHLIHLVAEDCKIDTEQYGNHIIYFPGDIETSDMPSLASYELYFLIMASVYYCLDEDSDDTKENVSQNMKYQASSTKEMVAEFVSLYCTDETKSISKLHDDKYLSEKFNEFLDKLKKDPKFQDGKKDLPTEYSIKGSEFDTERINFAKELKVPTLSHTIASELYDAFFSLYKNLSSSEFLNTLLDDVIKDKYHLLYIKNSKAESTFEDKKSNVKVVYGIKLEKDKFEDALRKKEEQAKQQSQMASQEEFLRFIKRLIIKYMPSEYQTTYADSKIDFPDLYTEVDKHTEDTTHTKTAEHNETTNQPSSNFIY